VHIDDVVAAYLAILDGGHDGPLNLVAPGAVRQVDFAHAVAAVLRRVPWEPLPAAAVRARLGPLADGLLGGRRAVPLALETAGFRFRRADAPAALAASLAARPGLDAER
jgi:NAD dependent epimerase/dehydratase family enzyme